MKYFITGAPVDLYDINNPDWAPVLSLGHSKFLVQKRRALNSVDRCVRSAKRQKHGPDLDAAKALLLLQKPTGADSHPDVMGITTVVDPGVAACPNISYADIPAQVSGVSMMTQPDASSGGIMIHLDNLSAGM
ncbi:hypothetical protein Pmani_003776 [Petrolisthes manimaculis]|uniref:Uncharacterized protein n=1 Tax=Petrolisthes manimaculis TaxID=1843537 RepID=A0AAE1UI52_9EUCA|nr:hypothetical protein Pmani_003776 [Petrolisthes manimaculis]